MRISLHVLQMLRAGQQHATQQLLLLRDSLVRKAREVQAGPTCNVKLNQLRLVEYVHSVPANLLYEVFR